MAAVDFRVGPVSWPRRPRDEDARDDGADVDLVGRKRKRPELPAGPAPKRWRVAAASDLASSPASSEPRPASPPPVKCELRPQSVGPPPVVPVAATAASTMEVKVEEENVKVEEGDVKAEEEDVEIEELECRAPRASRGRKQGPSRDRRSCHQCKRVKPRPEEMIRCLRCDLRIYCATCVRNRQCLRSISPRSVLSFFIFPPLKEGKLWMIRESLRFAGTRHCPRLRRGRHARSAVESAFARCVTNRQSPR
jgi:hypothetical protein